MLLVLASGALAAPASEMILYVGRLDPDAWPDTVYGIVTGDLRLLPTAIDWGSPYPGDRDGGDVRRTRLVYPPWEKLEGSFAVEDINADGLDDLLLFFRSSAKRDSSRAIALPGQAGLRELDSIDVGAVPRGMRRHPALALDIAAAGLAREPAERELSGQRSYRWCPARVAEADSGSGVEPPTTLREWMALYPNPATVTATFEAGRLARGEYTVSLTDIDGIVRYEGSFHVASERPISGTIDLSEQAPGLYLVVIRKDGRTITSYPVLVVH
jgi:hypothetical protein